MNNTDSINKVPVGKPYTKKIKMTLEVECTDRQHKEHKAENKKTTFLACAYTVPLGAIAIGCSWYGYLGLHKVIQHAK